MEFLSFGVCKGALDEFLMAASISEPPVMPSLDLCERAPGWYVLCLCIKPVLNERHVIVALLRVGDPPARLGLETPTPRLGLETVAGLNTVACVGLETARDRGHCC